MIERKPPREIDGAIVLEWAWAGISPFGLVPSSSGGVHLEIYGLAICRYPKAEKVYRFSCDDQWDTQQDAEYDTVEEAKNRLPTQYRKVKATWHAIDEPTPGS